MAVSLSTPKKKRIERLAKDEAYKNTHTQKKRIKL